jgi:Fe-S cluster assembly ATP-binding protein
VTNRLLQIRHLTIGGARHLVDDVDLTVDEAEIHALLGGNGSGKTSLAKAVMGCAGYHPDAGEILFAGQRIDDLPLHERARLGITLAWQEPARFEGVTVRDFLSLKHPDSDVAELLRRVGLRHDRYSDRMLDETLSGGERKRVELASVAALRPRLALLDEPAAGIDQRSLHEIARVVQGMRDAGSAILLISHRREMAHVADRASQMCGGRIIFSGDPATVTERYREHHCVFCDGELAHDERDT